MTQTEPRAPRPAAAPRPRYARAVRRAAHAFSWDQVRAELPALPGGGLNIAHAALHARALAHPERVAIRWLGRRGERREISYAELRRSSSRFANALRGLGVKPGEVVFSLMGRRPELYAAALGTLEAGAVFCPLFSAFGPEPIQQRLRLGSARVLVTTASLYERKLEAIRSELPERLELLVWGEGGGHASPTGTLDLAKRMAEASDRAELAPTGPGDPALLHFTSGTTGTPKGAQHVHEAVLGHYASARHALDLGPGDVYWCSADPGWVTGTSYGIVAPLAHGATLVVDEADFDAERWYRILQDERVEVWYTAPTAVRLLIKQGEALPARFDLSALRFVASVGEPLHAEAVLWGEQVLGRPIHDNWWQTETGGIMIGNVSGAEIRPGSMGRPLPGIDAALAERRGEAGLALLETPEAQGELVLRAGWPSMFRGYLGAEERYRQCFREGWYLSGDLARRDADGRYWFVGRSDDVIKSAGHLIGPTEVESALLAHPAVAEAGVIGVPDAVAGERVKAFVSLRSGSEATHELRQEILAHARRRLGPAVAPREIEFREALPRTRSGKILRRLLRARELGLPEGDLSTLETGA